MDGQSEAYARFIESMRIDEQKWRDAVGYDLAALPRCTPEEREAIERRLIPRAGTDWRDVEALLALGTPKALMAAHDGLASPDRVVQLFTAEALAVRGEPEFLDGAIIEGIEEARISSGLAVALRMAADHPSETVRRAMIEAMLEREREAVLLIGEALFGIFRVPFAASGRYSGFFEDLVPMRAEARAAALREKFAELGVEDPALDALVIRRRKKIGFFRRATRLLLRLICLGIAGAVGWHIFSLSSIPDRPFDAVHAPLVITAGLAVAAILLMLWFDGVARRLLVLMFGIGAMALCALSMRWIDASREGIREHWAGYERSATRLSGDLCYRIDPGWFRLRDASGRQFEYQRGIWPAAFDEGTLRRYFFSDLPMARDAEGWMCRVTGVAMTASPIWARARNPR